MAKKHYIIEAKGSEHISGNKITIEDYTYIEKNHRILEKDGKYRKINKDTISLSDIVSIGLFMLAVICLLLLLLCLALLRDCFDEGNLYIDNIISEIGLVYAIISTKKVRTFMERKIVRQRILDKLMTGVFIMLVTFYFNAIFAILGIGRLMSNCISVVCIILSLLSF